MRVREKMSAPLIEEERFKDDIGYVEQSILSCPIFLLFVERGFVKICVKEPVFFSFSSKGHWTRRRILYHHQVA